MKADDCSLCTSELPETKILLAHLRTKIFRQSQEYVPHYEESEQSKDLTDAFSRLLILMFGPKFTTNEPSFINCQHSKLSRYFRRKLKCDNRIFNSLCSQIASKIAQKNYQIEALCTQMNSIATTAEKQAQNPLSQQVVKRVLNEKQKRKKKKQEHSTAHMMPAQQQMMPYQMNYFWMNQPPPLMHYPWMFQDRHEGN